MNGRSTMSSAGLAPILVALLSLAPLAQGVPPPAYTGVGTGIHTLGDNTQCADATIAVALVKYPDVEDAYQLTWHWGPPATSHVLCFLPAPGSVNVTGTPDAGFVWRTPHDLLTLGPLGPETAFRYEYPTAFGPQVFRAVVSF